MTDSASFERLDAEAWQNDFSGWDWDYLSDRWLENPPSWDYRQIVLERLRDSASMLDMGTGGGEFLSSLQPFPAEIYATECYPPNIPIAQARLEPLGVRVLGLPNEHQLPFPDNSLELVINRHEGYVAKEVKRILKPGRNFITQQVGGRNMIELNQQLQEKVAFMYSYWTLEYALPENEASGLRVVDRREEYPATLFKDIGAVVYYMKAISWQVEGFTPEKYLDQLRAIHAIIQETGGFTAHEHRWLIEAVK